MPAQKNVVILGAGLAGLAASKRIRELGCDAEIYEKESYFGGHAASETVKGFTFDQGPHVSFTKRDEIKKLFADSVRGNYWEHESLVVNRWRDFWIKHPAQTNLHGLPVDLVTRCLVDFAQLTDQPERSITRYDEWCERSLGRTFTEEFTRRYTRKYWTADPSQMSSDWVGQRVYKPRLEEVIRGALSDQPTNHHYITHFRYPKSGGFGGYTQSLASEQVINYGNTVTEIDLAKRTITLNGSNKREFDGLISSLPLPEIIKLIRDVPEVIKEAAEKLVCTSLVLVNVGIEHPTSLPNAHWMYFYDEEVIFARGNCPHLLSPDNAPSGCGSFQAEIYHSKYRPLECSDPIEKTLEDMCRLGVIHKNDKILFAVRKNISYANVLFDLYRTENLRLVKSYLSKNRVYCCGRYGEWGYLWSDDSVLSGINAAGLLGNELEMR